MNLKSYDKALDLEIYEVCAKLNFISMWSNISVGDYENAMTNQLLYLVALDEWEALYDTFKTKDWDTAVELDRIAHGELY